MKRIFTQLAILASLLTLSTTAMAQQTGFYTGVKDTRTPVFSFNVTGYHSVGKNNSAMNHLSDGDKTESNMVPCTWSFFDDGSMLVTLPKGDGKADILSGVAATVNLFYNNKLFTKDVEVKLGTQQAFHNYMRSVYGGKQGNQFMYFESGTVAGPFPGAKFTVNVLPKGEKGNVIKSFNYNVTPLMEDYQGTDMAYMTGAPTNKSAMDAAFESIKPIFRKTTAKKDEGTILKKGFHLWLGKERVDLIKDVDMSKAAKGEATFNENTDYKVTLRLKDNVGMDYLYYSLEFFIPAGTQFVYDGQKTTVTENLEVEFDFNSTATRQLIDKMAANTNPIEGMPINEFITAIKGVVNGNSNSGYIFMRDFLSYFDGVIRLVASGSKNNKPAEIPVSVIVTPNKSITINGDKDANNNGNAANTTNVNKQDQKYTNVTLTRNMPQNETGWYTLCVPFSADSEQVVDAFGEGTELRKYEKTVGNSNSTTFQFVPANDIEAGKAYLIRPSKDFTSYKFKDVLVCKDDNASSTSENALTSEFLFRGSKGFADENISANYGADNVLYFGGTDGTTLLHPTQEGGTIRATRCYIVYPTNDPAAKAKAVNIDIDGEVTGIEGITIDNFNVIPANSRIYNLRGQYVGTDMNSLPRGIYIVNGKKVVK